jgi:hypothetical protein
MDYLGFLNSPRDAELDFGLTAASLICRLAPESDEIRTNGRLIERLHWLLGLVIDEGPMGLVIG